MAAFSVPIYVLLRLLVMVHVEPDDCMVGAEGPKPSEKYHETVKHDGRLLIRYVAVEELHIYDGPDKLYGYKPFMLWMLFPLGFSQ